MATVGVKGLKYHFQTSLLVYQTLPLFDLDPYLVLTADFMCRCIESGHSPEHRLLPPGRIRRS